MCFTAEYIAKSGLFSHILAILHFQSGSVIKLQSVRFFEHIWKKKKKSSYWQPSVFSLTLRSQSSLVLLKDNIVGRARIRFYSRQKCRSSASHFQSMRKSIQKNAFQLQVLLTFKALKFFALLFTYTVCMHAWVSHCLWVKRMLQIRWSNEESVGF